MAPPVPGTAPPPRGPPGQGPQAGHDAGRAAPGHAARPRAGGGSSASGEPRQRHRQPEPEGPLLWPPAETSEPSLSQKPLVLLGRASAGEEAEPRTVLWDGARRCFAFHWPGLLRGEANRRYYLEALREAAPWQEVVGPAGEVTRSTCWYVRGRCKCDYTYGCERVGMPKAASQEAFGQVMEELTERVFGLVCPRWPEEAWPNCASLNLYADDSQSVGWHADDESLFLGKEEDCLIVSLSLGERREFWLAMRRRGVDSERLRPDPQSILEVDLDDGDLLTMEGLCQKHCIHFVPGGPRATSGERPSTFGSSAYGLHGEELPEAAGAGGVRINVSWRWVREHKRKCPLARQRSARLPAQTPEALGGAVPAAPPAGDSARLWVCDAPVQWRRRCESCRWHSGRNCTRHRGRWMCRLCWQRQCLRRVPEAAAAAPQPQRAQPSAAAPSPEPPPPLPAPAPPAPALAVAARGFDGASHGQECLTLAEGVPLVLFPQSQSSNGWAQGAVLAGPAGWFPEVLLGSPTPAGSAGGPGASLGTAPGGGAGGAGPGAAAPGPPLAVARGDFDGGPLGTDYLTITQGAKLARLPHPAEGRGWVYGVVLVEPIGRFPAYVLGQAQDRSPTSQGSASSGSAAQASPQAAQQRHPEAFAGT